MRAGLHHLGEPLSRGERPDPRGDGTAFQERAHARHRVVQPVFGLDLPQPAYARRRAVMARAAGTVVPRAPRVPDPQSPAVRCADLLHVSVCADGARPRRRSRAQHPGADRAQRAGDPPVDLRGDVQEGGRRRLQHRGREEFPEDDLRVPQRSRGDRRLRRGPDAGPVAGRRSRARRRRRNPQTPGPAPAGARRAVPPPASPAGTIPPLRRPHRRRQRLRGAGRVLHEL